VTRLGIIVGFVGACLLGTALIFKRTVPVTPTVTVDANSSAEQVPAKFIEAKPHGASRIKEDEEAALLRAFQEPEDEAYQKIAGIVEDWAPANPPAVFSALLRAPEGVTRQNALLQLAGIWAESNPKAAADNFYSQTRDDERDRGVAQVIGTWAKTDPMAALNWVDQNNASIDSRSPLRERFYSSWAGVEPENAARYAMTHETTAPEMDAVFASWANSDVAAAVNFHKNQLPADAQNRARPVLLLAAAGQNSPLADRLLNDFLFANPSREEALRIGKALSSMQPRLAQALADRLPAGPDVEALRNRIAALNPRSLPAATQE
jgi:hypothetical protein